MAGEKSQIVSNELDRALKKKVIQLMRMLERIAQERDVALSDYRQDIDRLRKGLSLPQKDAQTKNALCNAIDALIRRLNHRATKLELKRKVKVIKLNNKQQKESDSKKAIVGWEEMPPVVGKRYRVFFNDGVYSTARVIRAAAGYFQTNNSVYKVEVLEQKALRAKKGGSTAKPAPKT
jgi:hypothetical protein